LSISSAEDICAAAVAGTASIEMNSRIVFAMMRYRPLSHRSLVDSCDPARRRARRTRTVSYPGRSARVDVRATETVHRRRKHAERGEPTSCRVAGQHWPGRTRLDQR
jgi:hypothetical protein